MAYYRKLPSKRIRAEIVKSGQRFSKTFDAKLAAQAWAISQEQEIDRNARIVRGKTLADAFSRYTEEVSTTKKGQRWEVIRLNKLCRADFASILLTDLHTHDIN